MFETINRIKYKKRKTDNRLLAIKDIHQIINRTCAILAVIFVVSAIFGVCLLISYQKIGVYLFIASTVLAFIMWCSHDCTVNYKTVVIKGSEYEEYKKAMELTDKIYFGEVKGFVLSYLMKVYPNEKYDALLNAAEEEKNYY